MVLESTLRNCLKVIQLFGSHTSSCWYVIFAQLLKNTNPPQIAWKWNAYLIISSFLVDWKHLPVEQCREIKLHIWHENFKVWYLKLRPLTSHECVRSRVDAIDCTSQDMFYCRKLWERIFLVSVASHIIKWRVAWVFSSLVITFVILECFLSHCLCY